MSGTELIYFGVAGCVIVIFMAVVVNFSVNSIIKQLTDRALSKFQERLSQEMAKALAGFRAGVCEQMAMQERKSDSLAKLYSSLIDLVRDGKEFVSSLAAGEPGKSDKALRTFQESSHSFVEQIRKQGLHFSDEYKTVMDGFVAEQETLVGFFQKTWKANGGAGSAAESRSSMRGGRGGTKVDNDDVQERRPEYDVMRQAWAKFEDRVGTIMEMTRNEFRGRAQTPESVMKKWLNDPQPKVAASGS